MSIKVSVYKQSSYPVNTPNLKKEVKKFLVRKGIKSNCEVSVAIVGRKKMVELSKKYLQGDKSVHNVLSFTESETGKDFRNPPLDVVYLGEVVLCFPKVREEANLEDKLIDEKAVELVKHGILHLLGIHHK